MYYKLLEKKPQLFDGSHNVLTPRILVETMLGKINCSGKILVLFSIEFVISLVHTYKVNPKMITLYSDHKRKTAIAKSLGCKVITEIKDTMKFDVVVGNPPFQDGKKDTGQNKVYNQFSKQGLCLLTPQGVLALITPTSVLKKSKRFSLINLNGLKYVDFNANEHFDVGVDICWWLVDKAHTGDVSVIDGEIVTQQSNDHPIRKSSNTDSKFIKIYDALKKATATPDLRMFRQNNFGPALSKTKTLEHVHALHKLDSGDVKLTYWSARQPYYHSTNKLSIGMTKSLAEAATYIGKEDFDPNYMTIAVANDTEIENIKSFIFSDYFREHADKWKKLDGYGYNYALKYLPPFDKTKPWTNESVKSFIESYVS